MSKLIGLAGGIAAGKTPITSICASLGAHIINTDSLGHKSYEKYTPAYHKIIKEFGTNILCSQDMIDRKKLGTIVFNDKKSLSKLNSIVWPYVKDFVKKDIESHPNKIIIIESALLFESSICDDLDEIWLVDVPREVQINRLLEYRGLNREEALSRIFSQMTAQDMMRLSKNLYPSKPIIQFDGTSSIIELQKKCVNRYKTFL